MNFFNANHRDICLAIANEFGNRIDANPKNFLFERKTGKIALIDTENFHKMTGMKEEKFSSYLSWGSSLTRRAFKALIGDRTKKNKL